MFKNPEKIAILEIHTCLPWRPKNDNTILEAKKFKVGIISEVDRLQKREGNLFARILYFSAHKSIRY